MAAGLHRIVIDTNILISAIGFGGKPRETLRLVLDRKLKAVSSPILLAEFEDVISKKFPQLARQLERIMKQLRKKITTVKPRISFHVLKDEPDNRVLEAAIEGKCQYIVTGDKELLELGSFRGIKIVTADTFLNSIKED